MSKTTEQRDEDFRTWKRNLDSRCNQWLDSHPECTKLCTSSFYAPITMERPVTPSKEAINATLADIAQSLFKQLNAAPVNRQPHPLVSLTKVEVCESTVAGGWLVKLGGVVVDSYFGEDAQIKASKRAHELLND